MAKLASEQIFAVIQEKFTDAVVEQDTANKDPFLVVAPERFVEIAQFCRDDGRLAFDLLTCITGVDYPDGHSAESDGGEIEVIYCLDSITNNHSLILKVRLPRDDPRVGTVESIWRGADWHERETFDLVGVTFEGHHNLIRILCAEDWVGHPLRKDYVTPGTYHGLKNVIY